MKMQYLNFKTLLLLLCFQVFFVKTNAQFRDNLIVFGKTDVPSLVIQPVEGGMATNLKAIKELVKYKDKPTLVVFWANKWCTPCLRLIDTLLMKNLEKQYNFISVNIEEGNKGAVTIPEINGIIKERPSWNKISHFQANLGSFEKIMGISDTPQLIFMDKNGVIIDYFLGFRLSYEDVVGALDVIKSGQYSVNGKYYFNNVLSTPNSAKTYTTKSMVGNYTVISSYYKTTNKLEESRSYLIKGNGLLLEGPSKGYYEDGKIAYDTFYENNLLLKSISWFKDGTIKKDINLPLKGEGYIKVWNEDGSKSKFYRYVNRISEGVSTSYDRYNKGHIYEYTSKNGVIVLEKRYINGVLDKEIKYVDGKPIE